MLWLINYFGWLVIRFKARLQQNTGFTLQHGLAMFTCSAITPPKVNWFGWNLQHSWVNCRALALEDIGRDPHSSGSWRARWKFLFSLGKQHTISPISHRPNFFTKFQHNTLIGVVMKTFGTEVW